jgi:osmotically-inducible protein OsmY
MNGSTRRVAYLGIAAAAWLSGCAVYEKCGFSGCPGDVEISDAVRQILEQHPGLGPVTIFNIKTLDGVVYLGGTVDTDLQKQEAEDLARTAPHVKKVVSTINPRNGTY